MAYVLAPRHVGLGAWWHMYDYNGKCYPEVQEVLNKTFELKATEVVLGSHIKLVGTHAGDNGPQNSGSAEFTLTWVLPAKQRPKRGGHPSASTRSSARVRVK